MRVCLVGYGSRGDVQPMIALGRGLAAAGHEVSVAATRDFTAAITGAGLGTEPFDVDLSEVVDSALGRAWLTGSSTGPRTEAALTAQAVRRLTPVVADTLVRIARRSDAVVSGVLTLDPMLSVAAAGGVRHALAMFAPARPTRVGAATLYPVRPAARSGLNLAAGYGAGLVGRRVLLPLGEEVRRRLGLPSQSVRRYLHRAWRTPALLAVSPHVVPPNGDPRTVTTGWWTADDGVLPPGVAAFLDAGEPPVYLGFGSMPAGDPDALLATVATALARTGRRGIVHGLGADGPAPDGVLRVGHVPHAALFARTAAVVHHGGSGTTGSAVRAGVPQLAVPHLGDQPYWGRRIAELGLGPPPLPRHALDAGTLTVALDALLGRDAHRRRAVALADAVRCEDGVARAVVALTRIWR